jgi:ubiquinone/menaquinone biosynthesis C-methylase UbiE
MTADRYAGTRRRWALGAELVYAPIAAQLVSTCPHPLVGRTVLEAGAGTGAASKALAARRARPIAMDLSHGMLAWNATARPPSAVADIRALPPAADSVDDALAASALNHLTDPEARLAELARVTRPAGAGPATAFSITSHDPARDRIDAVAQDASWQVPGWYTELKATARPSPPPTPTCPP